MKFSVSKCFFEHSWFLPSSFDVLDDFMATEERKKIKQVRRKKLPIPLDFKNLRRYNEQACMKMQLFLCAHFITDNSSRKNQKHLEKSIRR